MSTAPAEPTVIEEIRALIREEMSRCDERIANRMRPILMREFAKAKRAYRRLKGVAFINGQELYAIEPKADQEWLVRGSELPASIQGFVKACEASYCDQVFYTSVGPDIGDVSKPPNGKDY